MTRKISVFILAMMNIAIVMSLKGLPLMAKEGLSLVFYLGVATLFFLLPVSLISAELATGWPGEGGVYNWVKEAFGEHFGFIATGLQWMQNIVWYPLTIAFVAGALAYFFLDPLLATNQWFTVAVIWIVYWSATLLNLGGLKMSGWLTAAAVGLGSILPCLLLAAFGIAWVYEGNPLTLITSQPLIPDIDSMPHIAFLAGNILLFTGMEVNAVHAKEVENPKRNYPKAIFTAGAIILVLFFFSSLSIAAVVPSAQIDLTAGIMQAFQFLLHKIGFDIFTPLVGLLIALGAFGSVTAWIIGPSKAVLETAKEGHLPAFLAKTNANGVPVRILFFQGIIISLLSLVYLMGNVSTIFFMLTALTLILYLGMYILLYAAALRLRYTRPNHPRLYKVPGGNIGMWIVSGVGIASALFCMILAFFPPAQLQIQNPLNYVGSLVVGVICFMSIPFLLTYRKKPR